jgi:DNA-binding transcriptional LysR family regulator
MGGYCDFVTCVANVQVFEQQNSLGSATSELRQLRYFVKIIELRSLGRAVLELDIGVSALSQKIYKLESELCTRLLNRTSSGVTPTSAGFAF